MSTNWGAVVQGALNSGRPRKGDEAGQTAAVQATAHSTSSPFPLGTASEVGTREALAGLLWHHCKGRIIQACRANDESVPEGPSGGG